METLKIPEGPRNARQLKFFDEGCCVSASSCTGILVAWVLQGATALSLCAGMPRARIARRKQPKESVLFGLHIVKVSLEVKEKNKSLKNRTGKISPSVSNCYSY